MSVEFRGFDKFNKRVRELQKRADIRQTVAVGLQGTVDQQMIVAAAANEYGAIAGNGAVIPARPTLRPAMHSPELAAFVRKEAKAYTEGLRDLFTALSRIGIFAVGLVKRNIANNVPPPNAPSTIAKKGSDKTLIDTGRTRQAYTYKIVDKK